MPQTFGPNIRIRWDRKDWLNPKQTEQDFKQILTLVVEVRELWDHGVQGAVWSTGSGYEMGRASTRPNPTEAAAFSSTREQLRAQARIGAECIAEAAAKLEEAAIHLSNGILRTDPQEWIRALEKRRAALGQ